MLNPDAKLAVVGLGYVGLPLAVEFGKSRPVVGFDINVERIARLQQGVDITLEVAEAELRQATQLSFSHRLDELADCQIFIVTVPTPIDEYKRPLLTPLQAASESIGTVLKPGDIVIYESTVYPGATEEVCVPVLEHVSGLTFNKDFFVGYSPERINPGDKHHRLPQIAKITSGSTPEVAEIVDQLYGQIITAGTHKASTIRVAEAAKVIENTQRDVNIALINELALLFYKLEIDTDEVLKAAGTKWNFLPFQPGLVGGHCIGVDPYYLTHKAQQIGFHADMILAGRRINDQMGKTIAERVVIDMVRKHIHVSQSRVLVLGLTFKENCPDLRNTRVIDIIQALRSLEVEVDVHDPWADPDEARQLYQLELQRELPEHHYDAVILAVPHRQYAEWEQEQLLRLRKPRSMVFDVKRLWPREWVDDRL